MDLKALPPLHFLPAFEAAGRLGSFKAAAEALHITPSAVSQQIKSIEDAIGATLFERDGRGAKLTADGETYLRDVTSALGELVAASRRFRSQANGSVLRVSTVDIVGYELLIPCLSDFRKRFPDVELRIETSMSLVDLGKTSELDAAIRVGAGPWPGLVSKTIGPLTTTVVCSHELARSIGDAADAWRKPLIEMRGQEHRAWHAATKAYGIADPKFLVFDGYFETIRAAEQGLGLAFGIFPLTTSWVTSGRLAVPFEARVNVPGELSWVCRPVDAERPLFDAVYRWLCEQFAKLAQLPDGRIVDGQLNEA